VEASASGGGAGVEVGLTERHRSKFEKFNPRASSTLEKASTEIVDSTPDAVELEHVAKEK
jgi:hypothetical protein